MILYKDARESTKSDAGNCNREVCPAHTQLIHWPQKPRLSQNESERWYSRDLQYTPSTTVLFTRRTETFVSMNSLSLLHIIFNSKLLWVLVFRAMFCRCSYGNHLYCWFLAFCFALFFLLCPFYYRARVSRVKKFAHSFAQGDAKSGGAFSSSQQILEIVCQVQ